MAQGQVTASQYFEAGQVDACRGNLLTQIQSVGTCNNDYQLVDSTFKINTVTFTQSVLTCESGMGQRLCQALYDLEASYGWRCSGDACDSVWRNQAAQMNNILSWYSWLQSHTDTTLSATVGNLTYEAAVKMCSNRRTSEDSTGWIPYLVNLTNQAGAAMWYMQREGGVGNPYLCRETVN